MIDDSLDQYAIPNQQSQPVSFTVTVTGTDAAAVEAEAKRQAQEKVAIQVGQNAQIVGFDNLYVKINTAADGSLTYTATYTTTAASVPVDQPAPVTTTEQQNVQATIEIVPPAPVPAPTSVNLTEDAASPPTSASPTTPTTTFYENDGTPSSSVGSGSPVYYENDGTPSTSSYVTKPAATTQAVLPNPLHNYDSYTYSLSLHMMPINGFNEMVADKNPNKKYNPQYVLISSAGKYNTSTFVRSASFKEDFFFDDVKIKTIVNTTARNRNTNLVECSFTVIEPLGFTLINRLLEAASTINPGGNYLQMPYVLQIDYYGYIDGELVTIPNISKYLPIRLINMKTRLTSRGTEYQIEAVPYNHQAFNQLNVSIPVSISVTGSTVAGIFGSGELDPAAQAKQSERAELESTAASYDKFLKEANGNDTVEGVSYAKTRLSQIQNTLNSEFSQFSSRGLTNSINSWFNYLQKQKQIKKVNIVRVEFDPAIGNANLFATDSPVNLTQVAASDNSDKSKKLDLQAAAKQAKSVATFNGATVNIPAGQSIDKLIDWAVRNSSYIKDQINDPSQLKQIQSGASVAGLGLRWYRIVPRIKILEYDVDQNRYALDITYCVKPFYIASKHPYVSKGRVPGHVKRYDYIFTGKNKDVIDMQLNFDMLYLIEMTAYRQKAKLNETASTLGAPGLDPKSAALEVSLDQSNPHPVSTGVISDSTATTNMSGGLPQLSATAGDVHRNLMLSSKGDMIQVSLKIIGDPHFIKQDDIFYSQDTLPQTGLLSGNNSLWMDSGELYVFLNIESPTDYNESEGIASPAAADNKYRYSAFRGVYKVITVDSTFNNGRFEQTLTLAKLLYDQEGNPLSLNNAQRETTGQPLAQLTANQNGRFAGSQQNLSALAPALNTTAALSAAASAVTGGAASIGGQIQNAAVKAATGAANKIVSGYVDSAVSKLSDAAKNIFSGSSATPDLGIPGSTQVFDDGSTLQTFDDGSTLAIGTDGSLSSTDAIYDTGGDFASIDTLGDDVPLDMGDTQLADLGIGDFNMDLGADFGGDFFA